MLRHLSKLLCALVLGAVLASPANAELVTYNFNAPQFILGQTTPLLNRAPNIGPDTFRTDFTSTPGAGSFLVDVFVPNVLFSGQMVYAPVNPHTLTLTFNMPVDSVRLVFATIGPGSLILTTPVGGQTQPSLPVGGAFPGGTIEFSSAEAFTTLELRAVIAGGGGAQVFAIDNLTMNIGGDVIPEPSSLMLLAVGVVSGGGFLRWRRGARRVPAAA